MTNSIHNFDVILFSVFMIRDLLSVFMIRLKRISMFLNNFLCSRRFIKKILTNQNDSTQMKVDFKRLEEKDENKYAQIKNR